MEELYGWVVDKDETDWRAHLALARLRSERGERDAAFRLLLAAVCNNPHALAAHREVWKFFLQESGATERIAVYLEEMSKSVLFLDPYICINCSYRANGILWRCPHCQEWNTFVEERVEAVNR